VLVVGWWVVVMAVTVEVWVVSKWVDISWSQFWLGDCVQNLLGVAIGYLCWCCSRHSVGVLGVEDMTVGLGCVC